MAKLTLMFRGHPVAVRHLDQPRLLIGSDPGCDIHIDNLGVAPRNAEILEAGDGYEVRCLNPEFPIFVEEHAVPEARLSDGMVVRVGKYQILFSADPEEVVPPEPDPPISGVFPSHAESPENAGHIVPPRAFLQILNGPRIGKLLPIERPTNRLTHSEHGEVTLTREDGRYRLYARTPPEPVVVAGRPVDERGVELRDGQEIEIGPLRLLFCAE